jgi:hypothetical protein
MYIAQVQPACRECEEVRSSATSTSIPTGRQHFSPQDTMPISPRALNVLLRPIVAVRVDDGLITGLYIVRNPQKLSYVQRETALRR